MKEYETKSYDRQVVITTICDMCGKRNLGNDWEEECYDVKETEIMMRIGKHYPDCRWGEKTEIDLCPTCFKEKLIPWLESQGVKIQTKEY